MTDLYRHYDKNGKLLYVGISFSFLKRLHEHKKHSVWFANIASTTREIFATRQEAIEAEQKEIKNEKPVYNKQWNSCDKTPSEVIQKPEIDIKSNNETKTEKPIFKFTKEELDEFFEKNIVMAFDKDMNLWQGELLKQEILKGGGIPIGFISKEKLV